MVAAFDYCLHGKGGAAPSIDTAMHALVDAAHVDHLHPDSGIALATAVDGEELTRKASAIGWCGCRGGAPVSSWGWTFPRSRPPIRRPSAASSAGTASPPGATPASRPKQNSLEIIRTAEKFLADNGSAEPFGPVVPGYEALPEARAAGQGRRVGPDDPRHRLGGPAAGRALHRQRLSCWTSWPARSSGALAELGTSCPDHFLRTKVKPLVVDLPATATVEEILARLPELHEAYRNDYQGYYDRNATPDSPGNQRRGPGDRAGPGGGHVLLRQGQADRPGRRRVLRQRDQRDARRRIGLHLRPDQ